MNSRSLLCQACQVRYMQSGGGGVEESAQLSRVHANSQRQCYCMLISRLRHKSESVASHMVGCGTCAGVYRYRSAIMAITDPVQILIKHACKPDRTNHTVTEPPPVPASPGQELRTRTRPNVLSAARSRARRGQHAASGSEPALLGAVPASATRLPAGTLHGRMGGQRHPFRGIPRNPGAFLLAWNSMEGVDGPCTCSLSSGVRSAWSVPARRGRAAVNTQRAGFAANLRIRPNNLIRVCSERGIRRARDARRRRARRVRCSAVGKGAPYPTCCTGHDAVITMMVNHQRSRARPDDT